MAKKFENFLLEDMSKNVLHGGHKHELRIVFTEDINEGVVKKGFHDYMMRMAAEKYRKISGQDDKYRTSVEDRQMVKEIHDTGVWKTTDRFILGTLRTNTVVEKVPMTIEEMKTKALPGMDNAQLDDLIKMAEELKAAKELAEEHSDEETAIAAG